MNEKKVFLYVFAGSLPVDLFLCATQSDIQYNADYIVDENESKHPRV